MDKFKAILLALSMLILLKYSYAYEAYVISEEYISGSVNATQELEFDYRQEWYGDECIDDDFVIELHFPFDIELYTNTSIVSIVNFLLMGYDEDGNYAGSCSPYNVLWLNSTDVIIYYINCYVFPEKYVHSAVFYANASAPSQNKSLYWKWKEIKHYSSGTWKDCNFFNPLDNTTYVLAPKLQMLANVSYDSYRYRAWEWYLGLRTPPFVYVGDDIALGEVIQNIDDEEHGASAYFLTYEIEALGNVLLNETYYWDERDELLTAHEWYPYPTHTFKAVNTGVQLMNASVYAEGGYYAEDVYRFYILKPNITVDSPGFVDYNEEITIKFNVSNNATTVKDIYAVFTFYNVSNNSIAQENITMSQYPDHFNLTYYKEVITNDYAYTLNEYDLFYLPKYSGNYSLQIKVLFDNTSLAVSNTTSFEVKEGRLILNSSYPTYRILANQSGNITICFKVVDGDLYNLTLLFNTTSNALLIYEPYHYLGVNLSNGSRICENWFVDVSPQPSIIYANVSYKAYNLSWVSAGDKYFELIYPKIDFSKDPLSLGDVDEFYTEVKVVGNLSPLSSLAIISYNQTLFGYEKEAKIDVFTTSIENKCYAQEQQEGNELSSNSTVISVLNVDFANYSLDQDYNTYATFREYAEGYANLVIQLPNTYLLYKVAIYGRATSSSERLHIYYYDSSSDSYVETDETFSNTIYLPTSMDFTNLTFINAFKTDKLKIEIEGTDISYISEIKIYVARIDSHDPCYIFNFTGLNLNTSGRVDVIANVSTETNNVFSQSSFNILFGTPKIFFCNDYDSQTGNLYLSSTTKFLKYVHVYPEGGDIYNITLNLTILNTTYINFAEGESSFKKISYISYLNYTSLPSSTVCKTAGFLIPYNLTSFAILNPANTSINVSVYDSSFVLKTYNDTGIIDLQPEDTEPPILYWYYIGYLNENDTLTNYSVTNAFTTLDLYFKARDNLRVTSAIVEITYPDDNKTNYTSSLMLYNGSWSKGIFLAQVDGFMLNITGNYSIRVYALDYVGLNSTNNQTPQNLSVGSELKVVIEPLASIYNRGQQYTIRAKLLNGKYLGNSMNISMNLTRNYNITEQIICQEANFLNTSKYLDINCYGNSLVSYIKLNDTPSHYDASIFLQYFINNGSSTLSFDTSNTLKISAYSLTTNKDGMTYVKFIRAKITHQNNYDKITDPSLFEVNLVKCNDETTYFSDYDYDADEFYTPVLMSCTLPATISIYVVYYNNTATLSYIESSSSSSSSSGGGGGGGGGGSSGGGYGFIAPSYNYTPPIINLTFMDVNVIAKNMDEITQSSTRFFYIEYSNRRDEKLEVHTRIFTNCDNCNITPQEEYFLLMPLQTITKEYKLYVPLYQQPADYNISIYISNNKKEEFYKVVPFSVRKNPKIVILEKAEETFKTLKREVRYYASLGIDMGGEEKKLNDVENLFVLARQSIAQDNLTALILYLEQSQNLMKDIIKSLASKKWLKLYYLHKEEIWAYGGYALFALMMILFYILPLLSMITRLKYLRRKEKIIIETRKETEREYFVRKIDEITFRRIMEQEQDKLIKVRKEIEKLEKEIELMASFRFIELWRFRKELEERKKKMDKIKRLGEKNKKSLKDWLSSLKSKKKPKLKSVERDEIKYEVIKPKVIPVNITSSKTSKSVEPNKSLEKTSTFQEDKKEDLEDVINKIKKLIDEEEVDRT